MVEDGEDEHGLQKKNVRTKTEAVNLKELRHDILSLFVRLTK